MSDTLREAVGEFDDVESLEAAVFELETNGFDRAAFSVLASENAVEHKLGHRYQRVEEMADNPEAPRETFFSHVSRIEADYLPAPVLASVGALIFAGSGFGVPALIAAGGGAVLGAALGGSLHEHNAKRVAEQLARGGLLLWVNLRDAKEEETAGKVLRAHSAHNVHVHNMLPL